MVDNDLVTEVELLKREVEDMKVIHGRLDTAIEKITEAVSYTHLTLPTILLV